MDTVATIDWRSRAEALTVPGQCFINGRFVNAVKGETFANTSPADGRALGDIAKCDDADVDLAVKHARAAFEDARWAGAPPSHRKRVLVRFADLIVKHTEELALLETLDVGKPIVDSMGVDLPASAKAMHWYGEAIDKLYGEIAPTASTALGLISREPLGVVGAVVPWNFPLLMNTPK